MMLDGVCSFFLKVRKVGENFVFVVMVEFIVNFIVVRW